MNNYLTEQEMTICKGILFELLTMPTVELHKQFGSMTIKDMQSIYSKLRYRNWCNQHNIKYEDMTDSDYLNAEEDMIAAWRE